MNVYYTLKSGERLMMFFWDDYYPGKEVFHHPLEVIEMDMTSPGSDGYRCKMRKSLIYPGEEEARDYIFDMYKNTDWEIIDYNSTTVDFFDATKKEEN